MRVCLPSLIAPLAIVDRDTIKMSAITASKRNIQSFRALNKKKYQIQRSYGQEIYSIQTHSDNDHYSSRRGKKYLFIAGKKQRLEKKKCSKKKEILLIEIIITNQTIRLK